MLVTIDGVKGGSEIGSQLFCKPQVGGSLPLASSTYSADDSTARPSMGRRCLTYSSGLQLRLGHLPVSFYLME